MIPQVSYFFDENGRTACRAAGSARWVQHSAEHASTGGVGGSEGWVLGLTARGTSSLELSGSSLPIVHCHFCYVNFAYA